MPEISRFTEDDPNVKEIFRTTPTVTLTWEYIEPGTIDSYRIHYKIRGDTDWTSLGTTSAADPQYIIHHSSSGGTIGNGKWDLGVTAVKVNDTKVMESEIHSNFDIDAVPTTGWYLLWAK